MILCQDVFQYRCADLIRKYYDDEEDAWMMQRLGLMDTYGGSRGRGFGAKQ